MNSDMERRRRREANWLKSSRSRSIESLTPWEPVGLAEIFKRTGGHCAYCRSALQYDGVWEPDHVRPVRVGGSTTLSNLVPACRPCNRAKGGKWRVQPDRGEFAAVIWAWWQAGVKAAPAGYSEAPQCRALRFAMRPRDVPTACCAKMVEVVSAALRLPSGISVMIQREGGHVVVQVPRRKPLTVPLRTMWVSDWRVALGVDTAGRIFDADLDRAPHWLIAGVTGGGKSTVLRNVVALLAREYGPSTLRLVAIDTKGEVLCGPLATLPHVERLATNADEADAAMQWLLDELQDRIDEQRRTPRLVVAIDEAHDVPMTRLLRCAKMGRSFGIHLIMATQRAVGKDVATDLTTQCGLRVCTRLTPGDRWTATQMVPGHDPMALRGAGDILAWRDGEVVRFAGAYAPDDDPFWKADAWPRADGAAPRRAASGRTEPELHWSRRPSDMPAGLLDWIAAQSHRVGGELRLPGVRRIRDAAAELGRACGFRTAQRWQVEAERFLAAGAPGAAGAAGAD